VDQLVFVSGRVVEHQMHIEAFRHVGLDLIEEGAEPDGAVTPGATANEATRLHVWHGEQVVGACPAVAG